MECVAVKHIFILFTKTRDTCSFRKSNFTTKILWRLYHNISSRRHRYCISNKSITEYWQNDVKRCSALRARWEDYFNINFAWFLHNNHVVAIRTTESLSLINHAFQYQTQFCKLKVLVMGYSMFEIPTKRSLYVCFSQNGSLTAQCTWIEAINLLSIIDTKSALLVDISFVLLKKKYI